MSSPAPRGRPRKLPVDQQRTRVLRAAAEAVAVHGFQAATIEEIARSAGVSRQSVYEQFTNRGTLFAELTTDIEERAFDTISAVALDTSEPDLRTWARANYSTMFAFVEAHPEVFPVLREAERAGDPALTRLRERLAAVHAEASRQRWAAQGVDSGRADKALVALYFAMTEALVQMSWKGDPPAQETLVDLLTEFTVGGVLRLQTKSVNVIERLR
ncbi:TetR/AcrR family transcriptional regulator [Amycolatopsis jiangsuensis]|uniref:AcrR family transcriptional regulator n=1 Tax=Amycolatopsis jiangsuensis TaxID=1181879 RepID=A0A840J240_9PSEU|nr:TetR/AcrR family transcriptional regulator [Amycolatopsis jiangsuensis]MBB4687478.1 AcrR family transcriptional regulator [Amycolatopsis jiangsuensis]